MQTLKPKDWFPDPAFPFRADKVTADDYFASHKHDFFEFFLLVEGKLSHTIEGKKRIIEAGDMVLLNPARSHSFRRLPGEPSLIMQIIFLPAFLALDRKALREQKSLVELVYLEPFYKEGCMVFRLIGKERLKVQTLMEEMVNEYHDQPKGYQVAARAKLVDVLITVARAYEAEQRKNPLPIKKTSGTADAIINSLAYIEEHCTEPVQQEAVADQVAGITKEYFSKLFHKITGTTFTGYLTGLRVNRARELLAGTEEKVISICFESGFNDVSHFNRTFKKTTGVTPLQYRKQKQSTN